MSKAVQCDRCKKCFVPVECEGTMIKFRNPVMYTAEDVMPKTPLSASPGTCCYISSIDPDGMVDLCPACSLAFMRFLKSQKLQSV